MVVELCKVVLFTLSCPNSTKSKKKLCYGSRGHDRRSCEEIFRNFKSGGDYISSVLQTQLLEFKSQTNLQQRVINKVMISTVTVSMVIICLFSHGNSYKFQNESTFYAGLSGSLAEYFNSACIFFLTDSREQENIFLEEVIKEMSSKFLILSNVYTFEEYHYFQRHQTKVVHCYVPLQVVISDDDLTRQAFAAHSRHSGMHGSDSVGGGVWLLFLESLRKNYVEEYFRDVHTPYDVQLIVAELRSNERMKLKEVYRVRPDLPLRTPYFGNWSKSQGLVGPKTTLLYGRRSDLEGIKMKVGFVESNPYTFNDSRPGKGGISGYLGDVWHLLEDSLNFTSNVTRKSNYGVHKGNDTWSGLINHVQLGNFDVGIADYALTAKRFEVISYTLPLMITSFQVFYQTGGTSLEASAIFLPLDGALWATLLAWIILASVILYFGCSLSDQHFQTDENMTYSNAIFFVAGALCAQAGNSTPSNYTCRIFYIMSFIITSVVLPSYSASLMSYLTVVPIVVPFQNMRQFYEDGTMRMTVKYSSYEYDLFAYESKTDNFMFKIFQRDIFTLPKDDFPHSNREAMQHVCKNKGLAFFGLQDGVKWALMKEEKLEGVKRTCLISAMPHDAGKVSIGIIFPKNSHYRGTINHQLSYLPETGILRRLKLRHWPANNPVKMIDEYPAVGMNNLFMMFVILGSGVILSIIFLIGEFLFKRKRPEPPRSQTLREEWLVHFYNGVYNHLREENLKRSAGDTWGRIESF